MYTKEESKNIRQEFWTGFGKAYSKKWILYDTKIKGLQLKFSFDNSMAKVSMDISTKDVSKRANYFEKIVSLKPILLGQYLPDATLVEHMLLPEGKTISSIFVTLEHVNIHNKKDWLCVYEFFFTQMKLMEAFFLEHEEFIGQSTSF